MTARVFPAVVLALAAAAVSACGSSSSNGGSTYDAGGSGSGGYPGADGGVAGTTGSGGSSTGNGGTTGSGGAPPTGSGGGTGAGGAAGGSDAGSGDGGGGVPCAVRIDAPVDVNRVPAGPNATLRVHGVLTGNPLPSPPLWAWTVNLSTNNQAVPVTTPDLKDPSVIEFPTTQADKYTIIATVGDSPICRGKLVVAATLSPTYWVRILPPVGLVNPPPALSSLAPHDDLVTVNAGGATPTAFIFDHVLPVKIDPVTMGGDGVRSYVLITSSTSSWSSEGDTSASAFTTPLVDAPNVFYDVLIAPYIVDKKIEVPMFAPLFFPGNTAAAVNRLPLMLQPSLSVSGTLRIQGGAVVMGATVALRAGALPSTLGTSDTGGAYTLLAGAGRFSAVIVPPDTAMLPEAHVDANDTSGIDVPATATAPVTLSFSWRADLGAVTLAARFVGSDRGPAAGIDVQLDSDPGSLPNVGTAQVTGSASGSATFVATGVVHRTGTTDATGAISFSGLPRASYHLIAIPPVSSNDGITATAADLTAGAPAAPVVINLSPKVIVRGTILSAPAGTRIITLDDDPTLGHVFPAAAADTAGAFSMLLDPQHPYHLLVDPPAGAKASRVALGPVQTGTVTYVVKEQVLPPMVPFTGVVIAPDGATPVPGAQVQVFCIGPGPDCIAFTDPGSKQPLPLMAGVTDSGGRFSLWLPGP